MDNIREPVLILDATMCDNRKKLQTLYETRVACNERYSKMLCQILTNRKAFVCELRCSPAASW
jgi:hypothetical protein